MDGEDEIVICRHCGTPEYYGQMRWFDGVQMCRTCYYHRYELERGTYIWDDLDGPYPTKGAYVKQQAMRNPRG